MNKKYLTVMSALVLLGLFHNSYGVNNWPYFMGPNHNGTVHDLNIEKFEIKEKWKTNVGIGFSSITVVEGRIYTVGNQDNTDTVYCISAADGKEIWKYSYPCELNPNQYEGGPNSTPAYYEKRLYVLGKEGQLFCFDAENGKIIWSKDTKSFDIKPPRWGFSCSPIIYGDFIILNVGQGGAAFHKDSGELVWKSISGDDDKCYATPTKMAWKGEDAFTFFVGGKLLAVDPTSGKEYWHIPWKSKYDVHPSSPVHFDNKLFVSGGVNKECALYSLEGDKPELIWQNKNMHNDFLNSIHNDGYLYGIDGSASRRARLACVDVKTGDLRWKNDEIGFGSLLQVDDKLIILNDKGILFIAKVDPTQYSEIARKEILTFKCWTPPAIANGHLFARNANGDFVCVSLLPDS